MERTHIDIVIKAFKESDDNKNTSTTTEYDRTKEQFILDDACNLLGTKRRFMKNNVCPHYLHCPTTGCNNSKRCLKDYLRVRWGFLHGNVAPKFRIGDVLCHHKHPEHNTIKIVDFYDIQFGVPMQYVIQYGDNGDIEIRDIKFIDECFRKVEPQQKK